jgi:hypothetical protein
MLTNTHKIRLGISILVIGALIAVMMPTRSLVHASEPQCTASTIAGTYGFALEGLVSDSFSGSPQLVGGFYPLAAVGTFSFDGTGTSSRSYTLSFGGQSSQNSDSGPYSVNSDCTASATYSDGTWSFVIVRKGQEIKAMNGSAGVLVQGVLTRQ